MFVVSKSDFGRTTSCGRFASSSSCQSEYNGKIESVSGSKKSIAGLKGALRRNSSNLSQDLSQFEICKADATQIEIDCRSQVNRSFIVRVETPTMEVGTMHFSASGTTHMFTPNKGGCGHGVWRFSVYTVEDGHETIHSEKTMNLDGVGILFFRIIDDLEICLERQEFLHIAHCHTRKH